MPINILKGTIVYKKEKRLKMGLAASQLNRMRLQSRDHDITRSLLSLTMTKSALAADMSKVSSDYQKALSSKKMQWTYNKGITTSDISYGTLMHPNANNMQSPVLLTNWSGKIVVDSKYKKYAEMISPKGASGGKYEGDTRIAILSELTGIPEDEIKAYEALSASSSAADSEYTNAYDDLQDWLSKEKSKAGTQYLTADKLAEKLGSNMASLYKKSDGTISVKNENDIKSLITSIQSSLIQYFVDDSDYLGVTDKSDFKQACDDTFELYKNALSVTGDNGKTAREALGLEDTTQKIGGIEYNKGYKLNVKALFNSILDCYKGSQQTDNNDKKVYTVRNTTSSSYTTWHSELVKRTEALKAAETNYDAAIDKANQAMTAEQESMIKYYDDLFTAIVDNGWTYDVDIYDNDYLNQMLQNNNYYLTTMSKNKCYDDSLEEDERNYKYDYNTELASNFSNIVTVNDAEAVNRALAKFEDDKRKINTKESRIDVQMEKLKTEQSAIKQMMESIKKQATDNVERTMNIFG